MTMQDDRRQAGVTITNREIYDALQVNTQLTRDLVLKMTAIETRDLDHETRLRALERWRWQVGGVIALVSIGASAAVSAWIGA